MIRAFLFDIGNVLVRFDFSRAVRARDRHAGSVAESTFPPVPPLIVNNSVNIYLSQLRGKSLWKR